MFCGTIYQVMYMDHKELINKYRLLGKVKGVKPAIVRLRTNKQVEFEPWQLDFKIQNSHS